MVYKQVLLGDYFKFEKGLGYKGEFLVEDSEVALIGMDSHEEGGGYKQGSEKYYSGPFKEEHVAQIADVIFAGTEQGFGLLGSPLIVPENEEISTYLFSGDVLKAVSLKPDEFSTEYLYNIYRVEKYRRKVAYGDTGTTVRRVSNDNFAEQLVPLPDLKTQESINEVFSLIDQQIENNKSLVKNLEALAQAIFRSWFVDFEPVHSKARGEKPFGMDEETAVLFPKSFVPTEHGEVPTGWSFVKLGDVINILDSKRKPMSARVRAKRKGIFPYYGATEIVDYVDDFIFDGIYLLVGEDGTVMTKANTAVMQYVWGKIWVNNHAHVIQGNDYWSTEQIMLALENIKIDQFITGAVQLKLNQGNLASILVLDPGELISRRFNETCGPIFEQIRNLIDYTESLKSFQRFLLPTLIDFPSQKLIESVLS